MSKIQIFSVLGKNGVVFANLLHKTMSKLVSDKNELEFNCFMSSKTHPPKNWNTLECIIKQKHTSLTHTTGLNRAIDYVNGDYVILSDVDVAVLTPGWDILMIDFLQSNQVDIVGVDHWNNERGYKEFPIVTFFLTTADAFLKTKPDMRPNLVPYRNKWGVGANVAKITKEEEQIFRKKAGSAFLQDSGWQLPLTYKQLGLKGKVFPKAEPYIIEHVPQIWRINNEIAVCHKGKSSKRRKSEILKFVHSIENYIKI